MLGDSATMLVDFFTYCVNLAAEHAKESKRAADVTGSAPWLSASPSRAAFRQR